MDTSSRTRRSILRKRLVKHVSATAAILLATIMVTSTFPNGSADHSSGDLPPASGDWHVYNDTLLHTENITWGWNLTVHSGARLTLERTIIRMNSTAANRLRIDVLPGARLDALNYSLITRAGSDNYDFHYHPGSQGTISFSTVEYAGVSTAGSKGLRISEDNVTVVRSEVRFGYAGIYVNGSEPTIAYNEIHHNTYGIYYYGATPAASHSTNRFAGNQTNLAVDITPPPGGNATVDTLDLPSGVTVVNASFSLAGSLLNGTEVVNHTAFGSGEGSTYERIVAEGGDLHLDGVPKWFNQSGSSGFSNGTHTRTTSSDGGLRFSSYEAGFYLKNHRNPVFVKSGSSGAFDENGVSAPWVLVKDGTYHMFYAGTNTAGKKRIGHATSSDGLSWTRQNNGQYVLGCSNTNCDGTGSWPASGLDQPSVLWDAAAGKYKMWFTGWTIPQFGSQTWAIGYATSTDGNSWTTPVQVFNVSSDPSAFDDTRVDGPNIALANGTFHLFYLGYDGATWKVGHATSPEGLTWTRQNGGNPILSVGSSAKFDDYALGEATAIWDGGRFLVAYQGNAGSGATEYAVGVAETADGNSVTRLNSGDPVMTVNGTNHWDQDYLKEPTILFYGGKSRLWFAADSPPAIGYAEVAQQAPTGPADQYGDAAVINVGAGGKFDDVHVLDPDTLLDGSTYRNWYSGYDGADYAIGYATSSDGQSWTKQNSGNAVLTKRGGNSCFDSHHAEGASVTKDGTTYKMWYGGYQVPAFGTASWRIGYATSTDGVGWVRYSCSAVLGLGTSGAWDDNYVKDPTVIKESSNSYKMWYAGEDGSGNWAIGYATSTGGTSWSKYGSNPVFRPGIDGWNNDDVLEPHVEKQGNLYVMYFSARGTTTTAFSLGYAISSDGINWAMGNSGRPVVSPGGSNSLTDGGVRGSDLLTASGIGRLWFYGSDGNTYRMFYGRANLQLSLPSLQRSVETAVIGLGNTGDPDEVGAQNASVVQRSDGYWAFYECQRSGTIQLCLARSLDGVGWWKPTVGAFNYSGSYANNIVLALGATGKFDDVALLNPTVLLNGSRFEMWYAGHDGSKRTIGHAVSFDGLVWTRYNNGNAVLGTGSAGKFDDEHVDQPSVLKDGSTYRMWYAGYDGAAWRVGYATSPDGIAWTRQNSGNAVLDKGGYSGWFDYEGVGAPSVWKDGSTYRMLYEGLKSNVRRMLEAYSYNGVSWQKTHDQRPVLTLGKSGNFDDQQTGAPTVIPGTDGSVKVWYAGYKSGTLSVGYASRGAWQPPAIGSKSASNPVLNVGSSGQWDDVQIQSPSVLKDGETYKMWYAGHDGSNGRIGYATSADGVSWTKPNLGIHSYGGSTNNNIVLVPKSGTQYSVTAAYPSVIKDGSTYRMWFAGYSTTWKVFYATSTDGKSWTVQNGDSPVLSPGSTGEWDVSQVHTPNVWRDGNTFSMFYAGNDGTTNQVGWASSADGISWTKQDLKVPVMAPSLPGSKANSQTYATSLVQLDGRYYVVVLIRDTPTGPNRYHFRAFSDGGIWTSPHDYAPFLELGATGAWDDASHDMMGAMLYDGGTWKLWYTSNDGTVRRIGYAAFGVVEPSRPSAEYLSPVIGNGATVADWQNISWDGSSDTPVNMTIWTRSSWDAVYWSAWEVLNMSLKDQSVPSADNKYLQYRVTAGNLTHAQAFVLTKVSINYTQEYFLSGNFTSVPIASPLNISNVTPVWDADANGQTLKVWLSDDNGTTWVLATNNTTKVFDGMDNRLRYRVEMQTTLTNTSPVFREIVLTYRTVATYPKNVTLDIGADGSIDWQHNGTLSGSVTLTDADLVEELNFWLRKNQHLAPPIPFAWGSVQPGKLTLSSLNLVWNYEGTHDNEIYNNTYGLYIDGSSTVTAGSTTLTANTYGVYFESGTATVADSLITGSTAQGVVFRSSGTVRDSSITDNAVGVKAEAASGTILSSTVGDSGASDVDVLTGATLTLRDTTHDRHQLNVAGTGLLKVEWFLSGIVVDPDTGQGAGGVTLNFRTVEGSIEAQETTETDGTFTNITLTEVHRKSTGPDFKTPHRLTTASGNNLTMVMEESRSLALYKGNDSDNDTRNDDVEDRNATLLYRGWLHPDAEGGPKVVNDYLPLSGNGDYELYLHAGLDASATGALDLVVTVKNQSGTVLLNNVTRRLGHFQWYQFPQFAATGDHVRLQIDTSGNDSFAWVDYILLVKREDGQGSPTGFEDGQITSGLLPDTDSDALSDGFEARTRTYWWQAEFHENATSGETVVNGSASNGLAVRSDGTAAGFVDVSSTPGAGTYKAYVKSRLNLTLEVSPSWESTPTKRSQGIAWGDVDGDGDLDLAVANTDGTTAEKVEVYLNLLGTLEQSPSWESASTYKGTMPAWVDIESDGDLDLAMAQGSGSALLFINDNGTLQANPGWTSAASYDAKDLAIGDIDNDGDLDLVIGVSGAADRAFLNDGMRWSTSPNWTSTPTRDTRAIRVADINGDGKLDLVAASGGILEKNAIYHGDGTTFATSPSWEPTATAVSTAVDVADVDGDGDVDAVFGNSPAGACLGLLAGTCTWDLYRNNGSAIGSAPVVMASDSRVAKATALGDVDGDGDFDLVISDTTTVYFYENRGTGPLSSSWFATTATRDTTDLKFADVDRDGSIDLGMANIGGGSGQKNGILFNYGPNQAVRNLEVNVTGSASGYSILSGAVGPRWDWLVSQPFNVTGQIVIRVRDTNGDKGDALVDEVGLIDQDQIKVTKTTAGLSGFNVTFGSDGGTNTTHKVNITAGARVLSAYLDVKGNSTERPLNQSNASSATAIDVYDDVVVWAESGIWLYNYSNASQHNYQPTRLSTAGDNPRVYWPWVVWEQGGDIKVYDLSRNETNATLGSVGGTQRNPDVWGDEVVWEDDRTNGRWKVFLYDLTNRTETQITHPASGIDHKYPRVFGDYVVYVEDSSGTDEARLYDLGQPAKILKKQDRLLSHASSNSVSRVGIWSGKVAWINGSTVTLYDMGTNTSTVVQTGVATDHLDLVGDKVAAIESATNDILLYDLSAETLTRFGATADRSKTVVGWDRLLWIQSGDIWETAQYLRIDVGNDGSWDWEHHEVFTGVEITQNLADAFNTYVETVSPSGANVTVTLKVWSQYAAFLNVSRIAIELGAVTDPLQPDTDEDGVEDGKEVAAFFGADILEVEDAVDIHAWENPFGDDVVANGYQIATPVFIYQTGVALSTSRSIDIEHQGAKPWAGVRASWVAMEFHANESGTYRFLITPNVRTSIIDTVYVITYAGSDKVPVQFDAGSYRAREVDIGANDTHQDYIERVVAAVTHVTVEREGGGEVPLAGTATLVPEVDEVAELANSTGVKTEGVAILAYLTYRGAFNLSGESDYRIVVGVDFARLPAELDPRKKAQLGNASEVPSSFNFSDLNFIRLLDLDRVVVQQIGTDPVDSDSDDDGLSDGMESASDRYPLNRDVDHDGLSDRVELLSTRTDHEYRDSDYDGIRDGVELGLAPSEVTGDRSSRGSWTERLARNGDPFNWTPVNNTDRDSGATTTDPFNSDSDGDGLPDGWLDGWNYVLAQGGNRFRYNEANWKQTREYDNLVQVWEGEDLNLDGSSAGANGTGWGFANDTFERETGAAETNASPGAEDTDGDLVPDGYEVYFSTKAPYYYTTGCPPNEVCYLIDPTVQDGTRDSEVAPDVVEQYSFIPESNLNLFDITESIPRRLQKILLPHQGQDPMWDKIVDGIVAIQVPVAEKGNGSVGQGGLSSAKPLPYPARMDIFTGKTQGGNFVMDKHVVTFDPRAHPDRYAYVGDGWYQFWVPNGVFDHDVLSAGQDYWISLSADWSEYAWFGGDQAGVVDDTYYLSCTGQSCAWLQTGLSGKSYGYQIITAGTGGDNLSLVQEYTIGTNPKSVNTDNATTMGLAEDDGLNDGVEVGFFGNNTVRAIFRTNVSRGAVEYANYGGTNSKNEWIWYLGDTYNGNKNGYGFKYVQTVYDPPLKYRLSKTNSNKLVLWLEDNSRVILNTSASPDEIYVLSGNMSDYSEGPAYGVAFVFRYDASAPVNRSLNPEVAFAGRELYLGDPTRIDADQDGRRDGNFSTSFVWGEAPGWYSDSDGDGLINARDTDSDDDGVVDGKEVWFNGQGGLVGDIDKDGQAYTALDVDSDGDGRRDDVEWYGDYDNDGNVSAIDWDTDGDGLPDGCVDNWTFNPYTNTTSDPATWNNTNCGAGEYEDIDMDGIVDPSETSPRAFDTDQDGLWDGYSVPFSYFGQNPALNKTFYWFSYVPLENFDRVGELNATTNATRQDTDSDGLVDGLEVYGWGTVVEQVYVPPNWTNRATWGDQSPSISVHVTSDPNDPTTDNDTLSDKREFELRTNASSWDSDSDGVSDGSDARPLDADQDNDWLADGVDADDADEDQDNDLLIDGLEAHFGSNLMNANSDGDNLTDYDEFEALTTLKIPDPAHLCNGKNNTVVNDCDGDGFNDDYDVTTQYGVSLWNVDMDGDQLISMYDLDSDGDGVNDDVDPYPATSNSADTDGDKIFDPYENDSVSGGLKWNDPDTDGDNITDGLDGTYGGDVDNDTYVDGLDRDRDNDGLPDGYIADWCYDESMPGELDTIPGWGPYCPNATGPQRQRWEDFDNDGRWEPNDAGHPETLPSVNDTDSDGIDDGNETIIGTSPTNRDSDGDGVSDGEEFYDYWSDPLSSDTDGDGIPDGTEKEQGTYLTDPDTDFDGLVDGWDIRITDPDTGASALYLGELSAHAGYGATNPLKEDTDGDGAVDGLEVYGWESVVIDSFYGLNVLNYTLSDWERRGLDYTNLSDEELAKLDRVFTSRQVVSDPHKNDTDGDSLSDYYEYWNQTDPQKPDSDKDTMPDGIDEDPTVIDFLPPEINFTDVTAPWGSWFVRFSYSVNDQVGLKRTWLEFNYSQDVGYGQRVTLPLEIHAEHEHHGSTRIGTYPEVEVNRALDLKITLCAEDVLGNQNCTGEWELVDFLEGGISAVVREGFKQLRRGYIKWALDECPKRQDPRLCPVDIGFTAGMIYGLQEITDGVAMILDIAMRFQKGDASGAVGAILGFGSLYMNWELCQSNSNAVELGPGTINQTDQSACMWLYEAFIQPYVDEMQADNPYPSGQDNVAFGRAWALGYMFFFIVSMFIGAGEAGAGAKGAQVGGKGVVRVSAETWVDDAARVANGRAGTQFVEHGGLPAGRSSAVVEAGMVSGMERSAGSKAGDYGAAFTKGGKGGTAAVTKDAAGAMGKGMSPDLAGAYIKLGPKGTRAKDAFVSLVKDPKKATQSQTFKNPMFEGPTRNAKWKPPGATREIDLSEGAMNHLPQGTVTKKGLPRSGGVGEATADALMYDMGKKPIMPVSRDGSSLPRADGWYSDVSPTRYNPTTGQVEVNPAFRSDSTRVYPVESKAYGGDVPDVKLSGKTYTKVGLRDGLYDVKVTNWFRKTYGTQMGNDILDIMRGKVDKNLYDVHVVDLRTSPKGFGGLHPKVQAEWTKIVQGSDPSVGLHHWALWKK